MSIMVNPLNARLGVSRFWVTNFLPIVHSNYSLSMKRNYEDFVGTLEKFLFYFFNGPLRKTIFKLNIVYSSFKFNCFVFPKNNKKILSYLKQYHNLELIFHDFTSDYKYTLSILGGQARRLFQPVLRKQYNLINDLRRKYIKNGVKYVKLLRIQKQMALIFDVIKVYKNLKKDFRRILKDNIIIFQVCLNKLLFYSRINRLYCFFFRYNKLNLKIRFIPFSYRFSADFLSHFIIKKVKFGMPVFRVINMIYRFAFKNTSISGLRVVCGGRFHRGQKAGYFIRSLGRFSFGFFESAKKGYVLDYSETRLQLKKGLVGIRIWLSQKMPVGDHVYPLRDQYIKPSRKQIRYKFKYRNYNVF